MSRLANLIRKIRRTVDPLRGLDEERWLASAIRATPAAVAVAVPEWRGVYSSLSNLFPVCLPVEDGLTRRSAARVADLILQTGASRVVLSEFPPTYIRLLDALRSARRKIDVYAIWYGSFMQSGERRGWPMLNQLKELVSEGRIKKLGFAKSGMAEVFNRLGISSSFVLHAVAKPPLPASEPLPGGPHLGIAAVNLARWRKLPFAMLAATTEIPGAVVHVAGAGHRVADFARALRINARIQERPIPQAELPAHLRRMHLNLYVTLSECCPMLPQESLAEGVPCLAGPTSHLFEDSGYLHSRLVVDYPDRHERIARYIRQALDEREEIVAAYRKWQPGYWQRAQASVAALLDLTGAAERVGAAA